LRILAGDSLAATAAGGGAAPGAPPAHARVLGAVAAPEAAPAPAAPGEPGAPGTVIFISCENLDSRADSALAPSARTSSSPAVAFFS
jgi:hypothetical protein